MPPMSIRYNLYPQQKSGGKWKNPDEEISDLTFSSICAILF